MLNKVILMGRLTRDPELRFTQSNIAVTSFSIAVDRNYKSRVNSRRLPILSILLPGVELLNLYPNGFPKVA